MTRSKGECIIKTAKLLMASIYEIILSVPYTKEDWTYYTNNRADREQEDMLSRPEIKYNDLHMNEYDTILINYPIWHAQAPRILYTFLETYDFSGKTLIPFCTSHSSEIGSSAINLHPLVSSTVAWLTGKRFDPMTPTSEIQNWLVDLKIMK